MEARRLLFLMAVVLLSMVLGASGVPISSEVQMPEPNIHDLMSTNNLSDPNKDMYVIHAMVYQVGIITNKTDEELNNTSVGNQESVTFYHTNGSNIDLSSIPDPLMTNVTAQRIVGVAPTNDQALPWARLDQVASPKSPMLRQSRATTTNKDSEHPDSESAEDYNGDSSQYAEIIYKRSLETKEAGQSEPMSPVTIVSGAAVIPQEAAVQSLAIPPLLTLNNNFSEIPVPIPNTSIVHYAKINTLVRNTS